MAVLSIAKVSKLEEMLCARQSGSFMTINIFYLVFIINQNDVYQVMV